MKSAGSWAEAVPLSSDDSDSESKIEGVGSTGRSNKSLVVKSAQDVNPEGICFPDDEVGTIESTNKIVVVHLVKDVMSEGICFSGAPKVSPQLFLASSSSFNSNDINHSKTKK